MHNSLDWWMKHRAICHSSQISPVSTPPRLLQGGALSKPAIWSPGKIALLEVFKRISVCNAAQQCMSNSTHSEMQAETGGRGSRSRMTWMDVNGPVRKRDLDLEEYSCARQQAGVTSHSDTWWERFKHWGTKAGKRKWEESRIVGAS